MSNAGEVRCASAIFFHCESIKLTMIRPEAFHLVFDIILFTEMARNADYSFAASLPSITVDAWRVYLPHRKSAAPDRRRFCSAEA